MHISIIHDMLKENMFEIAVIDMKITYKKLWKLLIDKEMKKKDLAEKAHISSASIAKLGRNENVNTDIILKICEALNCNVADIMEVEEDTE